MERELVLTNLSPLVLRADRSRAQHNPSLDYIPGSTVRGALAAVLLQEIGPESELFQEVFVKGGASFGDLLPSRDEDQASSQLLPGTALACKRFGLEHRASLTDGLFRLAAAARSDDVALLRSAWRHCPEESCGAERSRVSAYCTGTLDEVPVYRRRLAGTAIRRTTGTVQPGQLYSQEALEEGQVFRGVVRCDGSEVLFDRLEEIFPAGRRFAVGAGKSRGLGLVEIRDWTAAFEVEPLDTRVATSNATWRVLEAAPARDEQIFTLTFTSHALLHDRAGRPVASLAGRDDLDDLFGLAPARLGRHALLPAVVRGWDARVGLPKHDEPAIGRGSSVLFHVTREALDTLLPRLRQIDAEGLGRRREEGFGRVRVCDAFHYRFLAGGEEVR